MIGPIVIIAEIFRVTVLWRVAETVLRTNSHVVIHFAVSPIAVVVSNHRRPEQASTHPDVGEIETPAGDSSFDVPRDPLVLALIPVSLSRGPSLAVSMA